MSYLNTLGLSKEPFSTSPDPLFFYHSTPHRNALARLEINIRLRRGLNVVLGDVGTGKTTLARTLIRNFKNDPRFDFFLIFDPSFQTEYQFLSYLCSQFRIQPVRQNVLSCKHIIENYLFDKNLNQQKTIVLLIDEAQKLSTQIFESIRVFLNYETNDSKLLQVVLLTQLEIIPKISKIQNFFDRISLKCFLTPLTKQEIMETIQYRLIQAGWPPEKPLFTETSMQLISDASKGFLRKVMNLCHQSLLKMVMYDRVLVEEDLVEEVIEQEEEFLNARKLNSRREVTSSY